MGFFSVSQKKGTITMNLLIPTNSFHVESFLFSYRNWFFWLTQLLENLRHTAPGRPVLSFVNLTGTWGNVINFSIKWLISLSQDISATLISCSSLFTILLINAHFLFVLRFPYYLLWMGRTDVGLLPKREVCDSASVNEMTSVAFQVGFKMELLIAV